VITDAHRARLADGALLAHAPRLEWSKLLRRTYAADVLVCPRCQGRARIIAAIQDPTAAARFLVAIRQQSVARASGVRDPDDDDHDSQLAPPSSRAPDLARPDD
jgi:hypothetical protein